MENLSLYSRTCFVRYTGLVISNTYGRVSGPIWLDDVACTGREANFMLCGYRGWGRHNCRHSEDVAISCYVYGSSTYVGQHFHQRSLFVLCALCLVLLVITGIHSEKCLS